jgi:uncharacterized protein (DUF885 family)
LGIVKRVNHQPTQIDRIANEYTAKVAALNPIEATQMGIPGHDSEMPDYSPDGHHARFDLRRETLARLEGAGAAGGLTAADVITRDAMTDRLGLEQELYEAGEVLADLNVVESPIQSLREVFDLMPTDTPEDWAVVAERLAGIPDALAGYTESLAVAAKAGPPLARRQLELGAQEARRLAGPDSFFKELSANGAAAVGDASRELGAELESAASDAMEAYGNLAAYLEERAASAPQGQDAFGRDRYALWSRYFVGAAVDLDEAYDWGREELDRITARQDAVAAQVAGDGATLADAVRLLDADPARKLLGTERLRGWMQETADAAMEALDGRYFDIPAPVRTLEAMIAPSDSGAIYYTGPSADFSRPGRMWWSVPPGVEEFGTWREKTTVHHEGVPGHHLQVGTATAEAGRLNDWRRLASWSSGYGEGWALYAEALMREFGFMDDPGDYLGLLDGQRLRAARVVFDIGVHLGKPAPEAWGGGVWDAAKGWEFLKANVSGMPEGFLRFEWARYLGWAGQAPSYKLGQRFWEDLRARACEGVAAGDAAAALRDFHNRALRLGSLPLSVLPAALGL